MEVDSPSSDVKRSGVDAMAGIETGKSAGRRDGRAPNEMRPLSVSQGVLSQADGSARFKFGGTDVLVGIYGPMECPTVKQKAEELHVQVSYRTRKDLGHRGSDRSSEKVTPGQAEATKNLQVLVSQIVLTVLHPRKATVVAIQVLADNGSVTAGVINATVMALIDAGVSMREVPTAACVSLSNNSMAVDPVKIEELEADAVITACFNTAVTEDGFISVHTEGDCAGDVLFTAAVDTCRQLAHKTREVITLCLEKKAEYPFVWSSV